MTQAVPQGLAHSWSFLVLRPGVKSDTCAPPQCFGRGGELWAKQAGWTPGLPPPRDFSGLKLEAPINRTVSHHIWGQSLPCFQYLWTKAREGPGRQVQSTWAPQTPTSQADQVHIARVSTEPRAPSTVCAGASMAVLPYPHVRPVCAHGGGPCFCRPQWGCRAGTRLQPFGREAGLLPWDIHSSDLTCL